MTSDTQTPPSNDPQTESSIRLHLDRGSTTDAARPAGQVDPLRIPRAFEQLGAPLYFTEQSRAYLVSLIRLYLARGSTTDAARPAGQVDPLRIPRTFEQLGAPLHLTEQSRAYLVLLPLSGTSRVAHEIRVAIDSGVPVKSVMLDIELDREEEWDELVAKLNVDQPADAALRTWEHIENRLYAARLSLSAEDRAKMEESFALHVIWEPELEL